MESYIVLGAPKSGTSLTMGLLAKMGVHIGDNLKKGGPNPNYFEDKELVRYDKEGGDPKEIVDKLKSEKWGMKLPQLVFYWQDFEPYIENPRFVVCHRDRGAHIKSFRRWVDKVSREEAEERINRNYNAVAQLPDVPTLHVNFEDWFKGDEQLQRLAEFAGLEVTEEARNLINPKLQHYK